MSPKNGVLEFLRLRKTSR